MTSTSEPAATNATQTVSSEHYLSTAELAERWRCAPKTLHNRMSDRRPMPTITRLPGGPRFALSDVELFELGQREG